MTNHLLDVQDLHVSFDTHAGEVRAVRGVSFWLDAGGDAEHCGRVRLRQVGDHPNHYEAAALPSIPNQVGRHHLPGHRHHPFERQSYGVLPGQGIFHDFSGFYDQPEPNHAGGTADVRGYFAPSEVSRQEAQQISAELLGQVGLPNPELVAKRYPHTMSGGQRQRVMIAMAVACQSQDSLCRRAHHRPWT